MSRNELQEGFCYQGPHSTDLSSRPFGWYKTLDERGWGYGDEDEVLHPKVQKEMKCTTCKALKKSTKSKVKKKDDNVSQPLPIPTIPTIPTIQPSNHPNHPGPEPC
jgi:hypothetical protein